MNEPVNKKESTILLSHGSGGRLSHDLISEMLLPVLGNPVLNRLDDAAVLDFQGRLAFTTDSYVVNPLFFPGGDIGKLCVCGTVNDLAMVGAKPLFISLALVIEEGFGRADLQRVLESIWEAAFEAEVQIVTGDTKVVQNGGADGIFINTAGIGRVDEGVEISGSHARVGDKVILSGPIGDHGIAVLSCREGMRFATSIESDCAPLNRLVAQMVQVSPEIHVLRDPTRGGLATALSEIATQSGVGLRIEEERIPVRREVRAACDMLGLDPLHIANEGKLVAIVGAEDAEPVLTTMRQNRYGTQAAIIGEVTEERPGRVVMKTVLSTSRLVEMPSGDLLPRIC